MPYWKPINTTYLYDGTLEGLFTIVFDSFVTHTIPSNIILQSHYVFNLLDHPITITSNFSKFQRIYTGILKNISYDTLYNSYYSFLSESSDREMEILQYLYHGFMVGPSINTMLSIPYVFRVNALRKKVLGEAHRLKGLVRFLEVGENLYYASIHPDHNVLELVGHHFTKRLSGQNFVIHDKNRNIAFFFDTKQYQIVDASNLVVPPISEKEEYYQSLWKVFFKTIAIPERTNKKCQMQYMPKKYWNDLVENP